MAKCPLRLTTLEGRTSDSYIVILHIELKTNMSQMCVRLHFLILNFLILTSLNIRQSEFILDRIFQ